MRGRTPKYRFGLYGPHSKLALVAFSMSATCALTRGNWTAKRHTRPLRRPLCRMSRVMMFCLDACSLSSKNVCGVQCVQPSPASTIGRFSRRGVAGLSLAHITSTPTCPLLREVVHLGAILYLSNTITSCEDYCSWGAKRSCLSLENILAYSGYYVLMVIYHSYYTLNIHRVHVINLLIF
jgi:hypothetical protein